MKVVFKYILSYLKGNMGFSSDGVFEYQNNTLIKAEQIVRLYYLGILFLLISSFKKWQNWLSLDPDSLSLLWPVFWVSNFDITYSVNIIMICALLFSTLSIISTHKALFRTLCFIFFFEFVAFNYSFGKIGHSYHAWLAFGFFLIFLPNKRLEKLKNSIKDKHIYLTVFIAAQAIILLFYSLAGFWKIYYGVIQFLAGEINTFSPSALAYQTAKSFSQKNSTTIFGNLIIDTPILGWPMYLGAIYLEFYSLVVAFRPILHRFWGLSLILFHIGSGLITGPLFANNILLLSILFVCSPFINTRYKFKDILISLPLFNLLYRLIYHLK